MDNPVIILGAKHLGMAAMEIFQRNQVVIYGFLDDDERLHGTEINFIPVLGRTEDDGFLKLIGKKCEAFVAIDDLALHKRLVKLLNERRKMMPVNAIHPLSYLADSATLGHGNFVGAQVAINAMATIGNHTLLHAGAVIEYEAQVGNFVQIGAGAVIGANVIIEEGAFIGSGAVIVAGVRIGKQARVGAGSVVVASVDAGKTVFGNPAQLVQR